MSKANLYKYHLEDKHYPGREIDTAIVEHGGFTDYYNNLVDSEKIKKQKAIKINNNFNKESAR